jgi:hypothetical protein
VLPLAQPDLTNLERVGYLPGLLAGLVALLALGTVTRALVVANLVAAGPGRTAARTRPVVALRSE